MQKAIIYCRVSSDKQLKDGHGLDSQEKLCRDYAASNRYGVLAVFREEAESGGLFDRPAMKQLLNYLDTYKFEDKEEKIIVIFDDIKRFARDVEIHFGLKREIYGRNGIVESPNFKFESTPEGKFVETMMAAAAELERNQNKRQVIQKMKARLQAGYWCFRSPPRGLKYTKDPIHGKLLVPDEPYATIYKEVIEKFKADILNSQQEVLEYIDLQYKKQGISKPITLNGVKGILTELLYTGYIEYSKWDIPLQKGKHEGFISLETHKNVLAKLLGKARKPIRKDYSSDFPLRGFVSCPFCQRPMTAAWCNGNGGKYPKYWCKTKECLYRSKTIIKTTIEEDFLTLLTGVKLDSAKAKLIQVIFSKTWGEEKESGLILQMDIERKKKELDGNISDLSIISSKTKDLDLLTAYQNQLKQAVIQRKSLDSPSPKQEFTEEQFQTASDTVFGILKEPVRMWQNPKYECKTTILQMYFPNRLYYHLKEGFQTVEIEPTISLINSFDPLEKPLVEMPGVEPGSERAILQSCSQA